MRILLICYYSIIYHNKAIHSYKAIPTVDEIDKLITVSQDVRDKCYLFQRMNMFFGQYKTFLLQNKKNA